MSVRPLLDPLFNSVPRMPRGTYHDQMDRVAVNRRILTDAIAVGGLTTLVKIAGAAKVVVGAHFFGASDALDAYLIAFLLPSFLSDVLAGGIGPSLIPTLIDVRETRGQAAAEHLYRDVLLRATAGLALLALIIVAISDPLLHLIASGFTSDKLHATRTLLFIMAPILPLTAAGVTWRSVLNAQDRFVIAAITPVVTPLTSIVALLLFGRTAGIHSLALGTLAGAVIESATLATAVRASGWRLLPRQGGAREFRHVGAQYAAMAVSNLVMGGSTLVDQTMAAMLGAGSVSMLNFGTRVTQVMLSVGPAALNTAILPRFSQMTARADWSGLRHTLFTYARLSIALAAPLTIGLIAFSEPLVRLLFQRGAFSAADTHTVALVQSMSVLQLPVAVLLGMLVRLASSLKANQLMLRIAGVSLAANAVLNYLFMRWLGVAGIALSTSAVQLIMLALLAFLLFRRDRTGILTAL